MYKSIQIYAILNTLNGQDYSKLTLAFPPPILEYARL